MKLDHFEPWSIVDLLHRDFNRPTLRHFGQGDRRNAVADWVPAIDIIEQKDRFVVRADVPGVEPADIHISMDGRVLSVAGERKAEDRSDIEGVQRVERVSGRFERRFTLPESADSDGITAKSAHGILEISIPKQPELQARRITVEAA